MHPFLLVMRHPLIEGLDVIVNNDYFILPELKELFRECLVKENTSKDSRQDRTAKDSELGLIK